MYLLNIHNILFKNAKSNSFTGGTLGLFTGISILSMVEVVFWIVRFLCKSQYNRFIENTISEWNVNKQIIHSLKVLKNINFEYIYIYISTEIMYLLHLHTAGSGQREPPDLWGELQLCRQAYLENWCPLFLELWSGGLPEARYLDNI